MTKTTLFVLAVLIGCCLAHPEPRRHHHHHAEDDKCPVGWCNILQNEIAKYGGGCSVKVFKTPYGCTIEGWASGTTSCCTQFSTHCEGTAAGC